MILLKTHSNHALPKHSIYYFSADEDGKHLITLTKENHSHYFLILSNNEYNDKCNSFLAMAMSHYAPSNPNKLQLNEGNFTNFTKLPDNFRKNVIDGKSFILIDKICRIETRSLSRGFDPAPSVKLNAITIGKIREELNKFLDTPDVE